MTARGGVVHWARDAEEANRIVVDLVRETGADEVVKVKSMATQEIGLNEALEGAGIAALETDLAELIVQLAHDRPSHILVPAIHRNRAEIREIFLREMPDVDPALTDEPRRLAMAARAHLRRKFLSAKVGISGANFAVADTGTISVVESEGNGRMCLTLPDTLITVMGIEKLVPTWTRPRGVPAAAAALLDRRADEPVHVDVDRGHPRRRAAGLPPGAARQRPLERAGLARRAARRCTASAARRASTSARSTSARAGTPTARSTRARSAPCCPRSSPASPGPTTSTPRCPTPRRCAGRASTPARCASTSRTCSCSSAPPPSTPTPGPTGLDVAMHAAAIAMTTPGRFKLAERALGLGRVLAGRKGRITSLPVADVGVDERPRHAGARRRRRSGSGGRAPAGTRLMDAREEVLARLRNGAGRGSPAVPVVVPRDYRSAGPVRARLRGGRRPARRDPHRLPGHRARGWPPRPTSPAAVAAFLERGVTTVVVAARPAGRAGSPRSPARSGATTRRCRSTSWTTLDAVVTGAAVAIADTGTFVLDSRGPGPGAARDHPRARPPRLRRPRRRRRVLGARGRRPPRPDAPADVRLRARRPPATSSSTASRASTVRAGSTWCSSVPPARERSVRATAGPSAHEVAGHRRGRSRGRAW